MNKISVDFQNHQFFFETDPSLFSPTGLDLGSKLLLETAVIPKNAKTILDLGCGWGAIGIILAKIHPEKFVYLVDNDPSAIKVSNRNLQINDVRNAKTFKADVTYAILPWKVDVIFTNPPWSKSITVIPALVKFSFAHLNQDGKLDLVINRIFKTQDQMEKVFGNVTTVTSHGSYKILEGIKTYELAEE